MKWKAASLSAMLVLGGATLATAGPLVDAATRAEALQAEGKTVEALDALDEAIDALWQQAPLSFRNVTLLDGTGPDAKEREGHYFLADDTLALRIEPVGFGYGTSANGFTVGFSGDVSLENATGQVLSEAKDLFRVSKETASRSREFTFIVSFAVPYVRPGEYLARLTVRDENSEKSATFEVPFSVADPAAVQDGPAGAGAAGGTAAGSGTSGGSEDSSAAPSAAEGEGSSAQ